MYRMQSFQWVTKKTGIWYVVLMATAVILQYCSYLFDIFILKQAVLCCAVITLLHIVFGINRQNLLLKEENTQLTGLSALPSILSMCRLVVDKDMICKGVCRSFTAHTGHFEQNQKLDKVLASDIFLPAIPYIRAAFKGVSSYIDIEATQNDLPYKSIRLVAAPQYLNNQEIPNMVSIYLVDITELFSTKKQLEELQKSTDIQIRERTGMLKYALASAQNVTDLKEDLIEQINHDLRTPLNAIIGLSDIINMGIHGPLECEKYKEYIRNINDSGHLLLAMVDDLLSAEKEDRLDSAFQYTESVNTQKSAISGRR